MRHLDLFSGIGGFALAAKWLGITPAQFVEIEPYCQRVLSKNFPGVPIHDDIATFTANRGEYDLLTAGFPCQDISSANPNGRGLEGKRSGLFYELMRIVRQCRPRYIVLENVSNLLSGRGGRDMGAVLWELSQCRYDAEWQTISAASVGAPHLRKRVFIVAYRRSERLEDRECGSGFQEEIGAVERSGFASDCNSSDRQRWQCISNQSREEDLDLGGGNTGASPNPNCNGQQKQRDARLSKIQREDSPSSNFSRWQQIEPPVLRVDDGVPSRVDRIRGLGNAVVPQCAVIPLQRVLTIAQEDAA